MLEKQLNQLQFTHQGMRGSEQSPKALVLLRTMLEKQLNSDVISYSALSHQGMRGSEQSPKALACLRTMLEKQLNSDVVTCIAAIGARDRRKQWQKALALLRKMLEKQPD